MQLKPLWTGPGPSGPIIVQVNPETAEVFITNRLGATVQVRPSNTDPRVLAVSTDFLMSMGEDKGAPALLVKL